MPVQRPAPVDTNTITNEQGTMSALHPSVHMALTPAHNNSPPTCNFGLSASTSTAAPAARASNTWHHTHSTLEKRVSPRITSASAVPAAGRKTRSHPHTHTPQHPTENPLAPTAHTTHRSLPAPLHRTRDVHNACAVVETVQGGKRHWGRHRHPRIAQVRHYLVRVCLEVLKRNQAKYEERPWSSVLAGGRPVPTHTTCGCNCLSPTNATIRYSNQPDPNSPTISPSQPHLVLRDTLCSCGTYGVRPKILVGTLTLNTNASNNKNTLAHTHQHVRRQVQATHCKAGAGLVGQQPRPLVRHKHAHEQDIPPAQATLRGALALAVGAGQGVEHAGVHTKGLVHPGMPSNLWGGGGGITQILMDT
jgi:hypothetical protein